MLLVRSPSATSTNLYAIVPRPSGIGVVSWLFWYVYRQSGSAAVLVIAYSTADWAIASASAESFESPLFRPAYCETSSTDRPMTVARNAIPTTSAYAPPRRRRRGEVVEWRSGGVVEWKARQSAVRPWATGAGGAFIMTIASASLHHSTTRPLDHSITPPLPQGTWFTTGVLATAVAAGSLPTWIVTPAQLTYETWPLGWFS